MSLSPDSILARLRQETRPYHDALEAQPFNQALRTGALTAAGTRHFLQKLYGFVVPFEAQLQAHEAEFGAEWELARRYRAQLLRQDLPNADQLPHAPNLPPLDTRARLLGALYVLEGSTLGGQVIARQLAAADITTRTYFAGRGAQTGPLWKSFTALLEAEVAAEPALADDVVASAALTFQRLHAWIELA
ncbi:biliverdin-producing heme oxygenase [Hymenobacter psychrophilus]|uniref:Heme oxygenase n=1 Tax=Hymenobacter psychrophilus TaxID=651662 RepID=A0A1H3FHJ3_9BACT|nr:biliverdin-producing heme oxygenase [Hymenobacter psychrophilus]SDX90217.1 Heme oxygenase [Hymenobacter psychrophilus]